MTAPPVAEPRPRVTRPTPGPRAPLVTPEPGTFRLVLAAGLLLAIVHLRRRRIKA
jgi:hypothetical protein